MWHWEAESLCSWLAEKNDTIGATLPSGGVVKADDKSLAGRWILDRGTDLKVELNEAVNSLEHWLRT